MYILALRSLYSVVEYYITILMVSKKLLTGRHNTLHKWCPYVRIGNECKSHFGKSGSASSVDL